MEIEVGEYVRTRETGHIGKIVGIIENFVEIKAENMNYIGIYTSSILKHSKNIIDLVEVGDYVNGHLVVEKYIDIDDNGNDFITIEVESDLMLHKSLVEKHIKSIVTKEAYKNIEYRLE